MHHRFKGSSWYPIDKTFQVIGAGGIGSHLIFHLARAGVRTFIFDDDRVDDTNFSGQLFTVNSNGMYKTNACYKFMELTCNHTPDMVTKSVKFTDRYQALPFLCCCPDNMETRKLAYESWVSRINSENSDLQLFLDGRLYGGFYKVICLTKDNHHLYPDTLMNDSEIDHESCTNSQNTHMAAMCAATMMNFITGYFTNIKAGERIVNLPFSIRFNSLFMKFEVDYGSD